MLFTAFLKKFAGQWPPFQREFPSLSEVGNGLNETIVVLHEGRYPVLVLSDKSGQFSWKSPGSPGEQIGVRFRRETVQDRQVFLVSEIVFSAPLGHSDPFGIAVQNATDELGFNRDAVRTVRNVDEALPEIAAAKRFVAQQRAVLN